ncbi:putative IS1016 transposase [Neisseria gonorrhoeae NCCP11945]|uniref:Putative IS1016 transposase n=1 Tax=Neisseria gonorrhoeae (strain NCCP11945) TaxID=521006 RepID=B4RQV1_NEIG2|nr:putative IS1016 transposase [Neisseria gonorrhoeae NCCP11945]
MKECGRRFDNSGVKVRISILKQLVKQDLSRLAGILKNKYIL